MRFIQTVPFVALAAAFVLPDVETIEQLALAAPEHAHVLWDDVSDGAEAFFGNLKDKVSSIEHDLQFAIVHAFEDEIDDGLDLADRPGHGHHGDHGHRGRPDKTIYELISKNPYSSNFTKLVNEYDDIVELLNSTKDHYTLFVPVNSAFAHLPDHGDKKPPKEFVEALVRYHIGLDVYTGRKILSTQTIPTALDEKFMGGEPQRLRTDVGLRGISVNFYSKVLKGNIEAKNGVIHAVNHILVPPPFVGRELSLFPNAFSTLLLAYAKTDFVDFIHGVKANGTTVFAPTNRAWAKLGPRANAFLFNTDKGRGFLKALLKYQIVANATLYSDAYYDGHGRKDEDLVGEAGEERHFDLTTLLHDLPIRADIKTWGGWVRFWVNGFIPVVVRDGVAKNGVVQVVGKVPLPPHKHHSADDDDDDDDYYAEVEVEDLIERLAPYVDEEQEQKQEQEQEQEQDWSDL